ncbi:MobF family relaxase [Actinoplanes sp. CA-030573]|uniref:MobF family relaxase n=1 Tax=Actinoplanes sp. CA-030573 TaxID=3239898 RepID=UPI003D8C77F3
MLSVTRIAPGLGIEYLTRQVAADGHQFRPAADASVAAYHADPAARGEAPGWWAGDSTALFGVSGTVSNEQIKRLIGAGQHPATGKQLGLMWRRYRPMDDAARQAAVEKAWAALPDDATYEQVARAWLRIWTAPERRPLAGLDVTVSPVKGVSLLWAFGNEQVKAEVMAAHHAGVRAAIAHLREHGAFTRLGANGLVQVDTDGLAVMVYDHRMSRERDPQLHSHIIVSSKVRVIRDGREHWLSLDSRAFYQASIGARAAYERAVEAELGRRLGVTFLARGASAIREVVGISTRALRQYAKRRAAIETDLEDRVADPAGGRPRVAAAPWRRMAQVSTLRTRPAPQTGESTEQAVHRWRREDLAAGLDTAAEVAQIVRGQAVDDTGRAAQRIITRAGAELDGARALEVGDLHRAALAAGVVGDRKDAVVAEAIRRVPHLAVERAVADVTEQRAVFGLDHLELALGRILHVDPTTGTQVDWAQVQQLAADAVQQRHAGLRVLTPPALVEWGETLVRGSDRQSIYSRHRDLKLSTRAVLAAEHEVIAYASRRGASAAPSDLLDEVADRLDLRAEKRAALHFAAGDDRRVTGIVGPAGSGKTYLQRAVGLAAQQAAIPVIGLTVGQNAAYVLAAATKEGGLPGIRTENIAMWLHAQDAPPAGTRAENWQFRPGQWVIIDEASQVSTHDLVRLTRLLDAVNGKMIMVGDPEQVSAVGPGGIFRYLTSLGHTTELTEIARFTETWEGPASLRLRAGDTTILAEYDRHQRILPGHRADLINEIVTAWTGDILAGRDSLIMVETEAEAADIAALARRRLIGAGIVADGPTVELADGTRAGVGDTIVTRRNNRKLIAGDRFVANRDQWRVTHLHDNGDLDVTNTVTDATKTLPERYVAEHVRLAYAATVDSAQGRTVDIGRAIVDERTSRARLYVMATRGRHFNEIGVVVEDEPPEGHPQAPRAAGIAVLADILRADTTDRSATETRHTLWADHDSLHYWAPVYDDLTARANTDKYVAIARTIADPDVAANLASDPALPALLTRLQNLAAAGYDPEQVLAAVITPRELDTANGVAAVLTYRIDRAYHDLQPDPAVALSPAQSASYTARLPEADGDIGDALDQVAAICDTRITALAELAADHRPAWTTALGPVPDDEPGRRQWLAGAAVVAAYRDRYAHTDADPIGPEPVIGADPQRWGAWWRAQTVIGVATLTGQLRAATETDLREVVSLQRAADRQAPDYAGGKLRVAHLQVIVAEQHVTDTRLALASAQQDATTKAKLADASTPRWWHVGPLRTRAVAQHTAATTAANRAADRLETLEETLDQARERLAEARNTLTPLEQQHHTWGTWYREQLPTRYAGLAANAELVRRQQQLRQDVQALGDAVRATTDKVRAVDATQPRPHQRPVPQRLAEHADTVRARYAGAEDVDPRDDLNPDPDLG